jgi:long-subunit fatty acid transport protein
MKKVLLTAAAVLSLTFVNAQEEKGTGSGFSKGDVFITGAVGYGTISTGDSKLTSFTLSPSVGFFVNENIAFGAVLGFNSSTLEDSVTDAFSAGFFVRNYFKPSAQFSVFAELKAAINNTKTESRTGAVIENELKTNGVGLAFAPGVNYFISDKFSIEATWGLLGYSTSKPDFDGAESTDNFSFGLNMTSLNFGLNYKF